MTRCDPIRLPQLAAVAIAWALIGVGSLQAQDSKPTEYDVKAAYLYNFGRFVEWPAKVAAAKGGSFTVCVLGRDPFGPALYRTVLGQTIGDKYVVAKPILTLEDAGECRILFISSSEQSDLKEILKALDGTSVLTVGDMPEFVRRGGMIQFLLENNRVRFEVNLVAASRVGLTLSSQLLKLAVSIQRTPQPGG